MSLKQIKLAWRPAERVFRRGGGGGFIENYQVIV